MITLYNVPVSSYGAKVRIMLKHKGLEWTEVPPPDGYGSAAYRLIVPAGTVPAIIHDGLTLADSEAIAEYLDERFPSPSMMPADIGGRAQARELSRFHDTRLEPVLRSFFGQVAPESRDSAFIAETGVLLQARLDQLAAIAEPAPLLTGETLAIADCGFAASFGILDLLLDLLELEVTLPPAIALYATRLAAHGSVAEEDSRYRQALRDWARSKGAL